MIGNGVAGTIRIGLAESAGKLVESIIGTEHIVAGKVQGIGCFIVLAVAVKVPGVPKRPQKGGKFIDGFGHGLTGFGKPFGIDDKGAGSKHQPFHLFDM
jgi:hypothetical protein